MTKINMAELLADREADANPDWTMHKCRCGHPTCDQWTFSEMGSAGIYGTAARRIARLPDLEAAYIEAVEIVKALMDTLPPVATDEKLAAVGRAKVFLADNK